MSDLNYHLVLLHKDEDKDDFIQRLNDSGFVLRNRLSSLGRLLSVKITEDQCQTIKGWTDLVEDCQEQYKTIKHAYNPTTRTGNSSVNTSQPAASFTTSWIPAHFHYSTGIPAATSTGKFGRCTVDFNEVYVTNLGATSIEQNFDGSTVDIVIGDLTDLDNGGFTTAEVTTHPDFMDGEGSLRIQKIDWSTYDADVNFAGNNTTSNNWPTVFDEHMISCASAAAGLNCGWAAGSNIYLINQTEDPVSDTFQAVLNWHNAKPVNPSTGKRNATIINCSWGWSNDYFQERAVKLDDISTFTTYDDAGNETIVNRPGGGWGGDYSAFINNGIEVQRVLPRGSSGTPEWCTFILNGNTTPNEATWDTLLDAVIDGASDGNLHIFFSAGNQSSIFARVGSPQYNNRITVDANSSLYSVAEAFAADENPAVTTSSVGVVDATYYPLRGRRLGHEKSFYIGAYQASQLYPHPEPYSSKGPGIDVYGQGSRTWTALTNFGQVADSNSYKWGYFSGTSSACPTVVGIVACYMDWYFYRNGSFPTRDNIRNWLRTEAKTNPYGLTSDRGYNVQAAASLDYSNVPSATTPIRASGMFDMVGNGLDVEVYEYGKISDQLESTDYTFTVGSNGSTNYIFTGGTHSQYFNGVNFPSSTLQVKGRDTITFNVNAPGHPFYVKTALSSGSSNLVSSGVTGQGTDNGTVTIDVDDVLTNGGGDGTNIFCQCSLHFGMYIVIQKLDTGSEYFYNQFQSGNVLGGQDGDQKKAHFPAYVRLGKIGQTKLLRSNTHTARPSTGQTYPRRNLRISV